MASTNAVASSSTCTPSYVKPDLAPLPPLTQEQQLSVVTQLMRHPPRKLLFDIVRSPSPSHPYSCGFFLTHSSSALCFMLRCNKQHEAANAEIFTSLDALERYLSARLTPPASTRNGPSEVQLEDEMHTGLHAAETLLTNQMDSAMDLLTSWTFRNAFTVGEAGSSIVLVRPPPYPSLTSTAVLIPVCDRKQSLCGSLTVRACYLFRGLWAAGPRRAGFPARAVRR